LISDALLIFARNKNRYQKSEQTLAEKALKRAILRDFPEILLQ